MKLRLDKGSITVRLTSLEVKHFNSEKFLKEKIVLTGQNQFDYSIKIEESMDLCTAEFKDNSLIICVPKSKVEKWVSSNQVGIKETIVTESGDEIVLILEEDLPRRKHRKEK